MFATLGKIFDQTVNNYPKREALIDLKKNKRWTYEEWGTDVYRLSNALLAAGVEKGDRVSTFLFNTSSLRHSSQLPRSARCLTLLISG